MFAQVELIIPDLCLAESEGQKVKVLNNEVNVCTTRRCEPTAEVTDCVNHSVSERFVFSHLCVMSLTGGEENCTERRARVREILNYGAAALRLTIQ